MKKGFSKLLITTTLFAGILAGCSGGGQETATSGGGDKAGSDAEVIKIGVNMELSGQVASYGQSNTEGVELAVEEINAAGGINGKQIELIKVDNKSDAAEATNAAIKLTSQNKVNAIIGASTSGNTVAQAQIANDTQTVLITPSGTSPTVTVKDDGSVNEFVFRTSFIDPFQGTVAANFANELGVKNAAIFADNASDYAKGLAASFKETFEAAGGTIVAEEAYVAKDTDFRSTLTRIKSKNPEFIFIPGYYEEVGLIIKQAREMGITVPLMGGDGWDSPKLVELAGAQSLNNTFITNHYSAEDPDQKIQDFVTKFKEKYNGKSPDAFNGLGYDSVYLLKAAIESAGSLDPVAVKDALAATKDLALVTGSVTIDENHHPIKATTVVEYVDGKQTFKTKVNP
ncbi:amino acid/amide ABC transporter substrate-binding protein, HAAT family [Schinkia azotoformans MEV2011]|uniref:Amino acid/amide ABC transporter substrate-binding protein, HAAT family n=1 Tax=Schinkia azotoformans MEV2011 TaxID=1348973 RepID=A0A072NHF3_SCHAZ|nr:ABC transporter substrate-binding protein [Schinkia azotoformans]KEF36353.1 amino acid/amide ABC transporter substrate-binding protein, HAAT family [Schinkia azotoformans MEV2011]MEC1697294.1 ABC transporter substrate-binding protein [Schinkia azotoformans]MEC1716286.1 ABC transporter substrate-binding protein [Schinkia azotoformans]MEC1724622.1 ABC transporter substrate-binding protein [Schinkia azotoformans]MEC1741663.1 ABC transporter substrate-binding protein [Schinkia azotoformans]